MKIQEYETSSFTRTIEESTGPSHAVSSSAGDVARVPEDDLE